jgi:nitrate reductase NapE component
MSNGRISDQDVERISTRVASKLVRYAVIGFVLLFVILPLLAMFFLGAFSFGGAPSRGF